MSSLTQIHTLEGQSHICTGKKNLQLKWDTIIHMHSFISTKPREYNKIKRQARISVKMNHTNNQKFIYYQNKVKWNSWQFMLLGVQKVHVCKGWPLCWYHTDEHWEKLAEGKIIMHSINTLYYSIMQITPAISHICNKRSNIQHLLGF